VHGRVFLSDERIRHIHAHTRDPGASSDAPEHGVFELPPAVLSHYGSFNHFLVNLAVHALEQVEVGGALFERARGSRHEILCQVLDHDHRHSLGHVVTRSAEGAGVHKRFGIKHAMVVLENDRERAILNLTTAFPARV
jgi:hypothetical protein